MVFFKKFPSNYERFIFSYYILYITYDILHGGSKRMKENEKKFKYGMPINPKEMPKPRERLPQYDECLKEFLESGHNHWEVNINALPSQKPRVVLSSLKWRIKNKPEFKGIKIVMHKNKIFLEREKQ
jgi:hypothetical protein